MLVSAILIWEATEFYLLKHFNINFNNFGFMVLAMCIISITVFILVYYPIYLIFPTSFIFNVICLFIAIYFSSVVGYYIMRQNHIKYGFAIGIVGILILVILFGIFTYFPIKNNLFVDPRYNKYGLIKAAK